MAIATTKFVRKPFYVDAVQVTEQNFMELAFWCQGSIKMKDDSEPERGAAIAPLEQYILVDVLNPKIPRQGQAHVGDWILRTDAGYKVYTDRAFENAFVKAEEEGKQSSGLTDEDHAEMDRQDEATQTDNPADGLHQELEEAAAQPVEVAPEAAQADTPTQ